MMTLKPAPLSILSSPAPPTTRLEPSPSVIRSLSPTSGLVESASAMKAPSLLQSIRPLSPKARFVPCSGVIVTGFPSASNTTWTPAKILSAPAPPKMTFEPSPVTILSIPPIASSIVSTRPSVSGSPPKWCVSIAARVTRPLSPTITLKPLPSATVTVSWPPPAMIRLLPTPTLIVSLPSFGSLTDSATSRFAGFSTRPSPDVQSKKPPSPKTRFVPVPIVISSSPAPPMTRSSSPAVVILSLPPMPFASVSTRASVIGRPFVPPKRVASVWLSAAVIRALSPRMTLLVEPPEIVSAPKPPTIRLLPVPVTIVSSPPTA